MIQGPGVDLRKVEVSLVYIVRFYLKTFHMSYSTLFGGRGQKLSLNSELLRAAPVVAESGATESDLVPGRKVKELGAWLVG